MNEPKNAKSFSFTTTHLNKLVSARLHEKCLNMSCRKEKEKLIEENQQLSTALCDLRNIFLNQEAKIKQLADVVNSFSSNFGLNKITKTFNANDFVRFLNRIDETLDKHTVAESGNMARSNKRKVCSSNSSESGIALTAQSLDEQTNNRLRVCQDTKHSSPKFARISNNSGHTLRDTPTSTFIVTPGTSKIEYVPTTTTTSSQTKRPESACIHRGNCNGSIRYLNSGGMYSHLEKSCIKLASRKTELRHKDAGLLLPYEVIDLE